MTNSSFFLLTTLLKNYWKKIKARRQQAKKRDSWMLSDWTDVINSFVIFASVKLFWNIMAIYRQKIPQTFHGDYPKNSLSWDFSLSIKNMVSFDLLLFMLKIETTTRGTNSMPFLVFQLDHLRFTLGIICRAVQLSISVGKRRARRNQRFLKKHENWLLSTGRYWISVFYSIYQIYVTISRCTAHQFLFPESVKRLFHY